MASTQILSEVIADQRAWTAQTIDTGESWRYALTPECFVELDNFLAQWHRQSQPITGTRVVSADFPACAAVPATSTCRFGDRSGLCHRRTPVVRALHPP